MHSLHNLHSAYSCRLFKEINNVVKQDIEIGSSAVGSQYSCRQQENISEGKYEITKIKNPNGCHKIVVSTIIFAPF